MAGGHKPQIVRQLRFVVAAWKEDGRSDVELLSRFCQWRDEQAFTTLVGRYSGLVWGACARVLGNTADAEDAFQATFLRLARDAKKILHRQTLATWLYRVARCSAIDLRRVNAKQKRIEKRLYEAAEVAGGVGDPAEHIRTILDDELEQLPERYRAVLILCHLEGRTYADASLDLGCSVAAVHRMAVKAQDMLRQRLLRRGCATTPAGLSIGVLLASSGGVSAAPARLLACCVEHGLKCATSGLLPATSAGALAAAAPAAGGKVAAVAWSGIVVGMALTLAAGGWNAIARAVSDDEVVTAASPARPASATPPTAVAQAIPAVDGETMIEGTARTADGEPVPDAPVVALARVPFEPAGRGLRDEIVARGLTRPDGKFTLRVPAGDAGWFTN